MERADRRIACGRIASSLLLAPFLLLAASLPASSERLENEVAVFAALDKVTAQIDKLEVGLNETKQFGSLKITPRVCYSRPPTETPKTTTFVEIDEVQLNGVEERIFTGWMFAESPGLNSVEHPVFDVWLTGCRKPTTSVSQRGPAAGTGEAAPGDFLEAPRRRVRR